MYGDVPRELFPADMTLEDHFVIFRIFSLMRSETEAAANECTMTRQRSAFFLFTPQLLFTV